MSSEGAPQSGGDELTVTAEPDIASIGRAGWDACALAGACAEAGHPPNPFVAYDFLDILEESGAVGARTGWLPQHLVLRDSAGAVLAVMPLYVKTHSFGEYVFDHAWAHAFENAGGHYYPKLQSSVPFTPVTGPRLMVRPGIDVESARAALASAAVELTGRLKASSLHVTFLPQDEWETLGRLGFLQRTDKQFHWFNEGYGTFDEFLDALASRKRKTIRKERRRALEDGIEIEWLTGGDLEPSHWKTFFDFYIDTGSRKWGRPYLNRKAFALMGERMADHVLLVMAKRAGRYVAGALNFIGAETLFGRYWGCVEHHDFLHFEVCYYQAMDYAIAHRLKVVEAGAQGPHKVARGYLPVTTRSAHHIAHPGLERAVADYLDQERDYVELEQAEIAERAPFRKSGD
jgi:predicted N-acyltransferase